MSLCNRVSKHQNKGTILVKVGPILHSSKCLSPCICWSDLETGQDSIMKWRRESGSSGSYHCIPPPRVKDGFMRKPSTAVSRDCDFSSPSDTWDSFILVGLGGGATNTSPPRGGEKGWREGEWVVAVICPLYNPSARMLQIAHRLHIRDHRLPCGEQRPNRFYCCVMWTTKMGLIIKTNAVSDLWSFWSMLG